MLAPRDTTIEAAANLLNLRVSPSTIEPTQVVCSFGTPCKPLAQPRVALVGRRHHQRCATSAALIRLDLAPDERILNCASAGTSHRHLAGPRSTISPSGRRSFRASAGPAWTSGCGFARPRRSGAFAGWMRPCRTAPAELGLQYPAGPLLPTVRAPGLGSSRGPRGGWVLRRGPGRRELGRPSRTPQGVRLALDQRTELRGDHGRGSLGVAPASSPAEAAAIVRAARASMVRTTKGWTTRTQDR